MSETWAIVLIDDEEDIREVMAFALADAGYDVRTAADGEAGIRMCIESPPQIVITDIRMPGMDGLQVLERVKHQFPDIEVIVATAFGEMQLAIRALQLDASDFITKPIGNDNLFLALDRARERYTSRHRLKDYTLLLEKEKAETSQQLLKTVAFQRNLIESSMDGILGVDERQVVVIYNRSMEQLSGYSRDKALYRMTLPQFFPAAEADRFQTELRGERFGGENKLFRFETLLKVESGREVPVQVSAVTLADEGRENGLVAVLEMSLDITERKELEEKLEKSERKYHEIFNHIPNPVFVLDYESLEILDCNKSVTAVYGLTRQDILGRSFLDLFLPKERNQYAADIRTASELNQIKHLQKNQSRLVVNIRISPGEYPGRKVLLVTTSDITKRLETEQNLIQASKMATLGEMATGIAHELNQPLSVIKTASSFFIKKLDRQQSIEEATLGTMLRKIDANVDRATRIIDHMRQFARKSDLKLERVQLNEVLRRAFDIFSQQLKLRSIEVVWEVDSSLPKIEADPGRLEQVFINLLINARDAIEERWGPSETGPGLKRIIIGTRTSEQAVVCEICDTGMGIPANMTEKIFEPFFTTKQAGKGTGLGLSISYGIVKDCLGSIKVKPHASDGACFLLEFPVQEKAHGKNNPFGR